MQSEKLVQTHSELVEQKSQMARQLDAIDSKIERAAKYNASMAMALESVPDEHINNAHVLKERINELTDALMDMTQGAADIDGIDIEAPVKAEEIAP